MHVWEMLTAYEGAGEHAPVDDATLSDMRHFLKFAVAVYALDPEAVVKQQRCVVAMLSLMLHHFCQCGGLLLLAHLSTTSPHLSTTSAPPQYHLSTTLTHLNTQYCPTRRGVAAWCPFLHLCGCVCCMCGCCAEAADANASGAPAEDTGNVAGAVLGAGQDWTGAPDAGGDTVLKVG